MRHSCIFQGEGERAFKYYLVGGNRNDNGIHTVEDVHDTTVVYRAGQVEKHDVYIVAVLDDFTDFLHGFLRLCRQQRERPQLGKAQVVGKQFLERGAALDKILVALTHFFYAVLRIVAVNDKDFKPFHIV